MSDVIDPPYSEWLGLLEASLRARTSLAAVLGEKEVVSARDEVIDCARGYTEHLERTAAEHGVKLTARERLAEDDQLGVVMAGHQPVVFHPGLQFKTYLLSKLASDTGALGIHVVIDTDVGGPLEVSWPRVHGEGLAVRRASIAHLQTSEAHTSPATTLYSSQRIKERDEIRDIFEEMRADLSASGFGPEAERARQVGAIYESLAGCSAAVANTIVRWSTEHRGYRELPLSMLVRQTSVRKVLWKIAQDSKRLFQSYNECLEAYRSEHGIKSVANPFPNLTVENDSCELPFWVVSGEERRALWSDSADPAKLSEEAYLAPRGSITTMILRAYCSDLFIHGLGGGKYDRFVTKFAAQHLSVELPPFVVASRTRYINPSIVENLSAAVSRGKSVKEVVSQTERYLGRGIFNASEEHRLNELLANRIKLREELAAADSVERRSGVAHELNQANREVREIVNSSALRADIDGLKRNERLLEQWSNREFPCFLFDAP